MSFGVQALATYAGVSTTKTLSTTLADNAEAHVEDAPNTHTHTHS